MKSKRGDMKNVWITTTLILILTLVLIPLFLKFIKPSPQSLATPQISEPFQANPSPQITPLPSPTPEVFHFDSTTNLKEELQSVNPKIEDSNIDKLKGIIQNL